MMYTYHPRITSRSRCMIYFLLQGHLSDIKGRKEVLMMCLLLSAVGYAMFGLATSVFFLFLARIPGGTFQCIVIYRCLLCVWDEKF